RGGTRYPAGYCQVEALSRHAPPARGLGRRTKWSVPMNPHPHWPLDSEEHLRDALLEQGVEADEVEELIPALLRLRAWRMPVPRAESKARVTALMAPALRAARHERSPAADIVPGQMWSVFWRQARVVHCGLWLATALCIAALTAFAALAPDGHGLPALTF